ncbi:MAG: hypothetical protein JST82_13830 [Bacteroidetes bacterium]|nr:hypothetical protein [Bacteroidota bacterium]
MGKPFAQELNKLPEIAEYVLGLDISELKDTVKKYASKPLFAVGSGGSLSACYFAELLHQEAGFAGKAVTPLETIYLSKAISEGLIFFITAGGRNKDILFSFDQVIQCEPQQIITISTTAKSLIAKKAIPYNIVSTFEFPLPTGKDGFLASNSLVAFFIILARAYGHEFKTKFISQKHELDTRKRINVFLDSIDVANVTYKVMYGGWGKPVAIDLESKLTEAALGNSLLADYRNFGHGRHHWLAKRGNQSAIVALTTPAEYDLAQKTLNVIPKQIPRLILDTKNEGPDATLDLLIQSFYLVDEIGKRLNIDPGRPGVPAFGSKLYNLSYSSLIKSNSKKKMQI